MDFISLATASHRFLRELTGGDNNNNDDFTSITGGGGSTSSDPSSLMGSSNGGSGMTMGSSQAIPDVGAHAPILSKTAEAELYLVASNFLLCE
jgi:hypothetical protein